MGSPHTLAHPDQPPHPGTLAAPISPTEAFALLNPQRAGLVDASDPAFHQRARALEDLEAAGHRAWLHQALESPPTPAPLRRAVLRQRAASAHPTTRAAEGAFDRLNPHFGVPADRSDPLGQQAVRDREAALALGPRLAVAASRENDRDPVVWLGGQDYRAAQAVQAARRQPTRTRWGPERAGAER